MTYIRNRSQCLTGCQDRSPLIPETDLQYDFIMVYGVDDEMPARIIEYREMGYVVHVMSGCAWGDYGDYLNGEWDGISHMDESQTDRNGKPILHGVDVPYLCPSLSFIKYLTEKLKPAVDAGAEAIHLEEPEFWDEGGYSEGFKREYKAYYHEDWQPPHTSSEARYRSSALKVYLFKRLVQQVSRSVKEYALSLGRKIDFYVPTHSLVNYTQWKILSPESTLLEIDTVDGCIAQVWTGTARCGNVYKGRYAERTFETAFLEYGVMQELVRGTDRKMWFLHDPVEDNPEHTWKDFEKNYLKTLIASLLHPAVHRYEVAPWPTRVMTGVYPKRKKLEGGLKPGESMQGAMPIPRAYRNLLASLFQTLGDMDEPEAYFEGSDPKVGVFMADSGLYERTFPDTVRQAEGGCEKLNETLFSFLNANEAGRDDTKAQADLMQKIASDEDLFTVYTASGAFPCFFGPVMPLVKCGIPVRPVQLDYPDSPLEYRILILSYEWMKPRSESIHSFIAQWIQNGGTLIYLGDGKSPYHAVSGWWNTNGKSYASPDEHLFELIGLSRTPKSGTYTIRKGKVIIARISPARISLSREACDTWTKTVTDAIPGGFTPKNHFSMRRGPYRIISVMEECDITTPVTVNGHFADMLTDSFALVSTKVIYPGENALLFDLDAIKNTPLRVIGTSARIESIREEDRAFVLTLKAAAKVDISIRIRLPRPLVRAEAVDSSGKSLPVTFSFDTASSTALLSLESTNLETFLTLYT